MPPRSPSDVLEQAAPIFRKYRLNWLAEATGYSAKYLKLFLWGKRPVSQPFKRVACAVLGEGETALFGREEEHNGRRPKDDPPHPN